MDIYTIFLIILSIFFFIIFFYVIFTNNNKLVEFRVIKIPIDNSEEESIINYDELKNKYLITKCKDVCKNNFCDEYQKPWPAPVHASSGAARGSPGLHHRAAVWRARRAARVE